MTAFIWTGIGIYALDLILNLRNVARHGQPRDPYHATDSALGAVIDVALISWGLAVLL